MTEGLLLKLMNAGSIPVYVYIDNVLVYIAIYVLSLSKDKISILPKITYLFIFKKK